MLCLGGEPKKSCFEMLSEYLKCFLLAKYSGLTLNQYGVASS
ncbi:hypothetical protein HMPREF9418_0723 [Neisseria macacae ATCC 33926]|uniref:Uncharacterized protein n=1 Tax=Neisseria macacae ATCC 33926 TaxID=997348 RepID=A0AA36UKJ3_9NEIS|nr:hypothetical protein HMPREF9418_0723 [Neisseria macacae ATCC 33926]